MTTGMTVNPTLGGTSPADSLIGAPIGAGEDRLPAGGQASEVPVARAAKADTIEVTVTGLGYDLVEVERLPRGLLRVTIDRLPGRVYGAPGAPDAGEFITVDDCERVTRQLQYALEVSGMAYERLEVSSPGLDRLLKTEDHFRRFIGEAVSITLKLPFQGRKHWTGVLQAGESVAAPGQMPGPDAGWRLLITEQPAKPRPGAGRKAPPKPVKPSAKAAARAAAEPALALDFLFSEVREARLVPVVDFKGRRLNRDDQRPGADDTHDEERVAAPAADTAMNGDLDR